MGTPRNDMSPVLSQSIAQGYMETNHPRDSDMELLKGTHSCRVLSVKSMLDRISH